MTRNELVPTLAQRFPALTRADVAERVQLLLAAMAESIVTGQRIEICGFGNFCLHFRPPRNAHNPKTGAKLRIRGKWMPHFRSGKALREAVEPSSETAQREAGSSLRARTSAEIQFGKPSSAVAPLIEASP